MSSMQISHDVRYRLVLVVFAVLLLGGVSLALASVGEGTCGPGAQNCCDATNGQGGSCTAQGGGATCGLNAGCSECS